MDAPSENVKPLSRSEQLKKWREEKQLRKLMEEQKKVKPFVCGKGNIANANVLQVFSYGAPASSASKNAKPAIKSAVSASGATSSSASKNPKPVSSVVTDQEPSAVKNSKMVTLNGHTSLSGTSNKASKGIAKNDQQSKRFGFGQKAVVGKMPNIMIPKDTKVQKSTTLKPLEKQVQKPSSSMKSKDGSKTAKSCKILNDDEKESKTEEMSCLDISAIPPVASFAPKGFQFPFNAMKDSLEEIIDQYASRTSTPSRNLCQSSICFQTSKVPVITEEQSEEQTHNDFKISENKSVSKTITNVIFEEQTTNTDEKEDANFFNITADFKLIDDKETKEQHPQEAEPDICNTTNCKDMSSSYLVRSPVKSSIIHATFIIHTSDQNSEKNFDDKSFTKDLCQNNIQTQDELTNHLIQLPNEMSFNMKTNNRTLDFSSKNVNEVCDSVERGVTSLDVCHLIDCENNQELNTILNKMKVSSNDEMQSNKSSETAANSLEEKADQGKDDKTLNPIVKDTSFVATSLDFCDLNSGESSQHLSDVKTDPFSNSEVKITEPNSCEIFEPKSLKEEKIEEQDEFTNLEDVELDLIDISMNDVYKQNERLTGAIPKRVSMLKSVSTLNSITEVDEHSHKKKTRKSKLRKSISEELDENWSLTPRRSLRLQKKIDTPVRNDLLHITPRQSMRSRNTLAENTDGVSLTNYQLKTSSSSNSPMTSFNDLLMFNSPISDTGVSNNKKSDLTTDFENLKLEPDENKDPNTNANLIELDYNSPDLKIKEKISSKNASLLPLSYSPVETRKSLRKSIRGDLISWSPINLDN